MNPAIMTGTSMTGVIARRSAPRDPHRPYDHRGIQVHDALSMPDRSARACAAGDLPSATIATFYCSCRQKSVSQRSGGDDPRSLPREGSQERILHEEVFGYLQSAD